MTEESISLLLGEIRNKLNNEDLGREFYRMISSNSGTKLIDCEHPETNDWACVTEMPCINGGDECLINLTQLMIFSDNKE